MNKCDKLNGNLSSEIEIKYQLDSVFIDLQKYTDLYYEKNKSILENRTKDIYNNIKKSLSNIESKDDDEYSIRYNFIEEQLHRIEKVMEKLENEFFIKRSFDCNGLDEKTKKNVFQNVFIKEIINVLIYVDYLIKNEEYLFSQSKYIKNHNIFENKRINYSNDIKNIIDNVMSFESAEYYAFKYRID